MPGPMQETLLRIAQEATSNAMRHSGGSQVVIRLDYARQHLRMAIDDNGRGLADSSRPTQSGGFGVNGMHSRTLSIGGRFSLQASASGGLAVVVEVPCAKATPREAQTRWSSR